MRFTVLPVLAFVGVALAVPQPTPPPVVLTERALPSGHPVIDNSFLSEYSTLVGSIINTGIYPSNFSIPTVPITALPSGYSVAWNGVYDPEGQTVSFFPSSVLQSVIAKSTTTSNPGTPSNPGAPSTTSTSTTATATSARNRASTLTPSFALGLVAIVMILMA